ncbi:hypothetical protein [Thermomonospora umbrina]|uniref:hypothetical protein n=1 Tax=Thermomonospora umbrina TaxID=111806 RepID=UPI001B85CDDC
MPCKPSALAVNGTQSVAEPRLLLLGYGDWIGPGSATLIGAGRDARDTVAAITRMLSNGRGPDRCWVQPAQHYWLSAISRQELRDQSLDAVADVVAARLAGRYDA